MFQRLGKEHFEPFNLIQPLKLPLDGRIIVSDVVKQFAGKWLSHEELPELADLAPGEAKVVVYENKKLAIYKITEGVIHAVNPVCTHMKCEIKWNDAEKSWDCPCHGSRYNYDGRVVTGPAAADLEQIEIKALISK